jgi:uncharacterized protein YdhG (YjbR/CyaY superfamily)
MTSVTDDDEYMAAAPETLRPLLVQLRNQLALALPDAEETIAYKMPGFHIGGSMIAGYAAFSKPCGLHVSSGAIADHADEMAAAGVRASKTGVTFSPRKPIPNELVEGLALASRKDPGV